MVQVPDSIIKEAEQLHNSLKDRGHLNINGMLAFLSKLVALKEPRKRKPKTAREIKRHQLFLQHLEKLSK